MAQLEEKHMRRPWLVALSRWHKYGTGRVIGWLKALAELVDLDFWASDVDGAMGRNAGPQRVPSASRTPAGSGESPDREAMPQSRQMPPLDPQLSPDDWRRIVDALRYLGRDLHHRSFAVSDDRRRLLWEEMDHCLNLAVRLQEEIDDEPAPAD